MYWKFLRKGHISPFTGFAWTAGEWVTTEGAVACRAGIHACRLDDLPYWLSDELWEIELAAPVVTASRKVLATRAQLVYQVDAWTPEVARAMARDCARRVVHHAVAELREAGQDTNADRLAKQPFEELSATAETIMEQISDRRRQTAKLCGYVVDAIAAIEEYPVATVAYMAARAANERSGPMNVDYYAQERAWQAKWLAKHLALEPAR
jgi:hypothetical protein